MKSWIKWTLAALVLALLAFGIIRAVGAKKAQQAALAAATAAKAEQPVELLPADVFVVAPRDLQLGVPITGTVRAVTSAVVKARVAGEVIGLTVREGDTVKAGQVLARIEATEYNARLRQAQQQADAAKAQIDIAQRQYDNNRSLVDQGFISKTALDTSAANLAAARASYAAAVSAADVGRKSVDDTVLRAPITGQVSQRVAQPGERVGVDARIVEIVDLGRLELEATLAAGDAFDAAVGQKATLQLDGGDPADGGAPRQLVATVTRINPAVQAGSRGVMLYLSLDNPRGLRQGSFLQGTLATGTRRALAVPLSAVRTDRPQPYVQLVENGRVAWRTVTTGARAMDANGEPLVAVTGVPDGAQLIRGGVGLLRDGTPARVGAAPSAAASAASR